MVRCTRGLGGLLQTLNDLEAKARHRIEVLEEDNSKTVLVFTVLTAIFLPLSFVTSYFGMNTKDIRDLERSQTLFWAVGLPVTFAVVVLAILGANNTDKLRNAWESLRARLNHQRQGKLLSDSRAKIAGRSSGASLATLFRRKTTDSKDEPESV